MTDCIAPPRVGEYPLRSLARYPNARVRRVARLLSENGYFENDQFTAELVRYYTDFVDNENGRLTMNRVRITRDPAQQRGSFVQWSRYRDGADAAPWDFAYLVPRRDAAPRVRDRNTRPDMPFLFGVRR